MIASWDVNNATKGKVRQHQKKEMKRIKINILGKSKVRWQGIGKIMSGTFEIFHSGGTEREKEMAIVQNVLDQSKKWERQTKGIGCNQIVLYF